MNRKFFVRLVAFVLAAVFVGILGCGGETPKQKAHESRLEKMRPKAEDRLSTLMDRSWDNLTYILYGFMSYDNEKIKTAADNLDKISPYMNKRIGPQYRQHREAWQEQCETQQQLAIDLKRQFEAQDFEAAKNTFRNLVGICMDCHKVYREHLFKAEEEEEEEAL